MKRPKLKDGAPKNYVGNHHLWFIREYRRWVGSKKVPNKLIKTKSSNLDLKDTKAD